MNWIGAFAVFWLLWTGKDVIDDIKSRFEEDDDDDGQDEKDDDTSTAAEKSLGMNLAIK